MSDQYQNPGTPVKMSQLRQFPIFGETIENQNRLTLSLLVPVRTEFETRFLGDILDIH